MNRNRLKQNLNLVVESGEKFWYVLATWGDNGLIAVPTAETISEINQIRSKNDPEYESGENEYRRIIVLADDSDDQDGSGPISNWMISDQKYRDGWVLDYFGIDYDPETWEPIPGSKKLETSAMNFLARTIDGEYPSAWESPAGSGKYVASEGGYFFEVVRDETQEDPKPFLRWDVFQIRLDYAIPADYPRNNT